MNHTLSEILAHSLDQRGVLRVSERARELRACALSRTIMTRYDSKAEIRLQSWQLGLSHDYDHAVYCSLLETNFVYLWGGYVLLPSPQGLVPVPLCLSEFLSKIGTLLLASSDIMEKNRNSLACLRNAISWLRNVVGLCSTCRPYGRGSESGRGCVVH